MAVKPLTADFYTTDGPLPDSPDNARSMYTILMKINAGRLEQLMGYSAVMRLLMEASLVEQKSSLQFPQKRVYCLLLPDR